MQTTGYSLYSIVNVSVYHKLLSVEDSTPAAERLCVLVLFTR